MDFLVGRRAGLGLLLLSLCVCVAVVRFAVGFLSGRLGRFLDGTNVDSERVTRPKSRCQA